MSESNAVEGGEYSNASNGGSSGSQRQRRPGIEIGRLLQLWFGFRQDVGCVAYAAAGFVLMLFKYAIEALVLWLFIHAEFSPLDFLNPILSAREELVAGAPEWLGWTWFVWTLPFLWIAVTMSVRRAANAGASPWLGLLVLVPVVNLVCMLMLAALPTRRSEPRRTDAGTLPAMHRVRSAVMGVGVGLLIAAGMVGIGIYVFDTYGASLVLGTPILMGAVGGLIYNSAGSRSVAASINLGMLTILLAGVALLLFALEGVICIFMAAPIAVPLGGLGGVIGKLIAEMTIQPVQGMIAVIVFFPLWAGAETLAPPQREFIVMTAVEIDALPKRVWENVIHFPDLLEPDEWYFRAGISCPMRARIEGQGVGAVRYCIFTTGRFVEPITV